MDSCNEEFFKYIHIIQTTNDIRDINKSIKKLIHLRDKILIEHPEYIESINDIDYRLSCAAYRINDNDLLEKNIQKHYYNDYRFKKLYHLFNEMKTISTWNNIVKSNATRLQKTFIRSLGIIILTCVCLTLAVRK